MNMLNRRDVCYRTAKLIQAYISPSKPFEVIFARLMLMSDKELEEKQNEVNSVKDEMILKRAI